MATKPTWKPHTEHGELATKDRQELPDSAYAFPKQRKEPLTDAAHVKNALARFDQVKGITDEDRVRQRLFALLGERVGSSSAGSSSAGNRTRLTPPVGTNPGRG